MPSPSREVQRSTRGRGATGLSPVRIYAGVITDVDPIRWTCTVRTELFERTYRNIAIGSAYAHPLDGEGIHAMPESGAPVWVGVSTEGDLRPFIIGFRGYYQQESTSEAHPNKIGARANRPTMQPGDIFLQTRDRNGLRLRRGGVTEIFASPLVRTSYLSREQTIHSICKNLKVDTFGGSLRWTVNPAEKDDEGKEGASLTWKMKEFTNHKGYVVRVDAGSDITVPTEGQSDGEEGEYGPAPQSGEVVASPVLRLRVFEDGDQKEEDLQEVLSLAADKEGQVEFSQTGTLRVSIRGENNVTLTLSPDGKVSLEADGDVEVTTSGSYIQKASSLQLKNDGNTVAVGTPTAKVLYDQGFSSMLVASLTEIAAGLQALGLPMVSTNALLSALNAGTFTAKKLETE
jgi:hypothetical protein